MTIPTEQTLSSMHGEEREHMIDLLIISLETQVMYGDRTQSAVRNSVMKMRDSTIDIIANTAAWNRNQKNLRYRFMYSVITELDEPTVREVMHYRPEFIGDINTQEFIDLTKGLHAYDYFKNHPCLEELTGRDHLVAKALLNITNAIEEFTDKESLTDEKLDKGYKTYIHDVELLRVIIEHAEQWESALRFIRDRGTEDAGLIRAFLENGTALSEGIL